jgi:myo-inositol-1(or 4)-monophosphatase
VALLLPCYTTEVDAQSPEETAIENLLTQAGSFQLDHWPGRLGQAKPFTIETKCDGSQVTSVDLYSNKLIAEEVIRLFPTDMIMSEEEAIPANIQNSANVWILDPLDGTQSFVEGRDDFAILLARSQGHQLTSSYMYMPARKIWGRAEKGRGAFVAGQRVGVSASRQLRTHSVCLRHLHDKGNNHILPRWYDSARAFFSVASGDLDGLVVRIVRHQEWDLAAGACLVEQSGGLVTDEHGSQVAWGMGKLGCEYLVVSNGHTHPEILKIVSRIAKNPRETPQCP